MPQCTGDTSERGELSWIMSIVSCFNKLNESDQEKYLQLHNVFNNPQDLHPQKLNGQNELKAMLIKIFGGESAVKMLEILNIFETNFFSDEEMDFLGIQTSRFNHSCFPNADWFGIPDRKEIEIRAMSSIKEGEEITIKYFEGYFSMTNQKSRQERLKVTQNFLCLCNFCKDGVM